ncbi:MAG: SGNH/GDSL hydrolase family protein [Planctomycetes bacterium]|nr:SGNH/GDSL hydrolase family protein [Planctomycetota bacterium]MCH9723714.1 SGNH/GDSL hydrolase family protein [Planctomycetota bacterium]MCH9776026.1 SGNH/GDSL hydrolase family protein [Planctomycetota bacterium]MCH9790200.1 SGNH/GDSL hydrolase family protein [Planctomycetota bacterium]MDF1746687.1 SGNH/GDSL hydrolase family protein [Gimesia sp.]
MTFQPRPFVLFFTALLSIVALQSTLNAVEAPVSDFSVDKKDKTHWFDIKNLGMEGKGWTETESFFDRLPKKAKGVVRPPVWSLSKHSAGMAVRFVTNATSIKAKWELTSPSIAMNHMAATGVSGLDLYVKTESGKWRWLAVGKPSQQKNSVSLTSGLVPGKREYILYLPLYNGVKSVEIGIPESNQLWKAPAREPGKDKPLIFWGTSITQGGCASRTGMVHTAILGRRLDRPVINLGFSGNGRMEPEVAKLIAELDASVFIMDCLPNVTANVVKKETEPLVKTLRAAHPETPILLVEDRTYSNAFLKPSSQDRHRTSRLELRNAYERLKKEGVKNLYYLEGNTLLGDDSEDTVDGSHPTDLGFFRQADAFEKVLKPILEKHSK